MKIGLGLGISIVRKLGGASYGDELLPDGFTTGWTLSAQPTITDGVLNLLSTDGSFQQAYQGSVTEVGKTYRIVFDVVVTSGTGRFRAGTGATDVPITETGKIDVTVENDGTNGTIFFMRTTACDIDISNISIREVL